MKKISILVILAVLFTYLVLTRDEYIPSSPVQEQVGAKLSSEKISSALEVEKVSPSPATGERTVQDEVISKASAPVLPSGFFPNAEVISSVEIAGDSPDESKIIKVVETKMEQPYVRIVETFVGRGPSKQLVGQAAMVANQVLLGIPNGINEGAFVEILVQAGAEDVRKVGAGLLATFTARPEDPLALDAFIAKVREVSKVDVVIEPNYLRKII